MQIPAPVVTCSLCSCKAEAAKSSRNLSEATTSPSLFICPLQLPRPESTVVQGPPPQLPLFPCQYGESRSRFESRLHPLPASHLPTLNLFSHLESGKDKTRRCIQNAWHSAQRRGRQILMIGQNATHRASQGPLFANNTVTRATSVASK